jgi:BirA family transcriptional regulator, biotin operon repressor / biotin---[acetyl-CoA-carboxylase] ligase
MGDSSIMIKRIMDQDRLRQTLAHLSVAEIVYFPSLTSTNDEARRRADAGAPDLTLVVADEQTAGRGRAGRRWVTTPGSSLAFTLVLRLAAAAATTHYAGLGALAVCSALRQDYGLEAQIKWPNDVLLDGLKVAGVLVEAQWSGDQLLAILLGIGVNLSPAAVPDPALLAFPATCVEAFTQGPPQPEIVLRQILERLFEWRALLGRPEFLAAWQEHLAWKGQRVRVSGPDAGSLEGVVKGLDADGALVLQGEEGITQRILAGDLHLRLEGNTGA